MRFRDIPSFTRSANYRINVGWSEIDGMLDGFRADSRVNGLSFDLDPDFQRGHVWTEGKQVRYVEFILRGGASSRDIRFNCPGWQGEGSYPGGRFVLVDGKQRLEAVRRFLRGEIRVFGCLFTDFTDRLPLQTGFVVHVNNLTTDAEVLQWYLDLNDGGVVHTQDELDRVRGLLAAASFAKNRPV
jgi:hypothetical protein